MLAYAHVNSLSMLSRFVPDEVVRVAMESIYIRKPAIHKVGKVDAFVFIEKENSDLFYYALDELEAAETITLPKPPIAKPAQWRDKNEQLYPPAEHTSYFAKPECI